jgi:hypothetical protein
MKVRYIGKESNPIALISGKIYECNRISDVWCYVIDEEDEEYLYPKELFEIIDENTAASTDADNLE